MTLAGGGGGDVLWQLAEDSTATDGGGHKLYGWDARVGSIGTTYSDASVSSGGPSGQTAVRFTYLTIPGQDYIGGQVTVPAPAFGVSRFLGGFLKIDQTDADAHTCKFLIVADAGGSNRPIVYWGTHGSEPDIYQVRLAIDGGGSLIGGTTFPRDTWHRWKIELFPGNAASDGQGYYSLWTGAAGTTFTYGSPTGTVTGLSFTDAQRAQWGSMGWGYYHNDPTQPGDNLLVTFCDCYMATTWAAGLT